MEDNNTNNFTEEDLSALRDFIRKVESILQREPQQISGETWDVIFDEIDVTGQIPAEYTDRVGINSIKVFSEIKDSKFNYIPEGKTARGYYDKAWESWNAELVKAYNDAQPVLSKILTFLFLNDPLPDENGNMIEKIKGVLNSDTVNSEQIKNVLPQLSSIIPKKHVIPNNKLSNRLTKEILNIGEFDIDVGRKGQDLTTRCILSYEGENVKLSSRQPFTEYDRQVADAVTSLYEYGDKSHIVTAATVYRAMVHATATETPSPQQIGAVTRSLDKMRFVRVQIDCTAELIKRNISLNGEQVTGGKIDTYLLALEKMEVIAGGKKITAYKVIKTPILYEYSRLTKQVITVPAKLLDIRDSTGAKVANTERRIAIKGYLIRRISVMKGRNRKKTSRHILYETIYNEINNCELTDKEKRAVREYIPQVLDYWKKQRFIKDYTYLKQGRKKTGVEILP